MKHALSLCLVLFSIAAFGQNPTIDTVSISTDQQSYNILVRGTGPFEFQDHFQDDPPRITIDFQNVRNRFTSKAFQPKPNPFVEKIRSVEFFKEGRRISRILVELKGPVRYEIKNERDLITVGLRNVSAVEPAKNTSQLRSAGTNQPAKSPSKEPKLDIVVGAEDLLDVNVFELPQFSGQLRVAGDGTISMPLVGSIEVRGLTKKQVEEKIAKALEAKYINNPNVSVTIKEYKSRQVSILGAIKNPGSYFIISSRTLLQVLSEAGGLTPEAGTKCYIFRQGSDKVEIDLVDLMNNGNQDLNVPVLPGDVINIPPEAKVVVYVLGAVRSPGAIEMTTSMPITLLAAIARAGGPSEEANKSNIQIKRRMPDGTETVIKANLKDIMKGKAEDVRLQSGDVINVPESFF